MDFTLRPATLDDIPALDELMHLSIGQLLKPFLTLDGVAASFEIMGLDTQLVADGTYFAAVSGETILGCGGWSRRATLFGGDHTGGRDSTLLDPARDAARVRAMYTHPDQTRRGIGRAILHACEDAARAEGFSRVELVATLAGEPLYRACGYELVELLTLHTSVGVELPLRRMGKRI